MAADNPWARNQLMLANAMLGAAMVGSLLTARDLADALSWWMFATFLVTAFYFYFGYLFLAMKGLETRTITQALYDFILIGVLFSLLFLSASAIEGKATIWLAAYLALFLGATLKYAMLKKAAAKDARAFLAQKLRVDSVAAAFILATVLLGSLGYPKTAIGLLFAMELGHMLYVGLVTRFYEKA